MKQADIKIILRPGTDGAFACGVMHVLFRDGYADRAYMDKYTDCPAELEAHLKTRTPEWASAISSVPVAEIEAFAKAVGETKRTFIRLGYGFTRSRNGATQMHALPGHGDPGQPRRQGKAARHPRLEVRRRVSAAFSPPGVNA